MESYDCTTAVEAMLTKGTAAPYYMGAPLPLDVVSQWKAGQDTATPFNIVESAAMPQLAMESASYRFGVSAFAGQTFTLRGDSLFYNPGASVVELFVGSGTAGQTLALTHPAGVYNGDNTTGPRRILNLRAGSKRLFYGVDYTEAVTGTGAFRTVTATIIAAVPTGTQISATYFTNDVVTYPQNSHAATTVKPAAIRGRDITLLVNGVALTNRWVGVQSVQVDERLTVDRDLELGNAFATAVDYTGVPQVNGNIVVRFRDPADFHARLAAATGVATLTEAIGTGSVQPNRVDVVLHHPDTGAVLKTLEIPDAKIIVPGYQGRVNTKLDMTLNIESDSGTLNVLSGAPA